MAGGRRRTTIQSSERARELAAASAAARREGLTAEACRKLCRGLVPEALEALRAALATPGERVAAARAVLERALPNGMLGLSEEGAGPARMVLTLLPDPEAHD